MDNLKYIDTHSHIHFKDFDEDRQGIQQRMKDNKVGTIVIGTSFETTLEAVKLAEQEPYIWACIGVHPNTIESFEMISMAVNSSKISLTKIVGVGECGLDYFRNDGTDESERSRQERLFRQHIEFAIVHNLPLMLHIRSSVDEHGVSTDDAHNDALKILQEYKDSLGNNADTLKLHCHFTTFGTPMAQKFIELDDRVTFGIPGVVTYKNAKDLQSLVTWLPLEKILGETDAPYAAPVPHRGKRNESVFVIDTINAIADLREENREVVRKQLLENAQKVFNSDIGCLSD